MEFHAKGTWDEGVCYRKIASEPSVSRYSGDEKSWSVQYDCPLQ